MSGTSLDGVDAVLVDFTEPSPQLLGSLLYPFPAALRQQLADLSRPGSNEIERMGIAEAELALCYHQAVQQLLAQTGTHASAITAIGCHGQTIRHRPNGVHPFTYQIGDMHKLAEWSQIRVVGDFRRRDIALGGQGAPLVPAFHHAIFSGERGRCILNIGGIANVTLLLPHQTLQGFDTGPGNCLLDSWVELHQQQPFDASGQFAASGRLQPALLASLFSDPYFSLNGPKSTGREYFHLEWLRSHLNDYDCSPADVQRTLCRFSAGTMALAISRFAVDEVFVCGGGAHNPVLLQDLAELMPATRLSTTAELGVHPDWVEAMAFAWLAFAHDQHIPGNVPAVTGARRAAVLGVNFPFE